ncbi:long-chain fatty acid transport protein 4-like [Tetranychus urticae]|uniref:Long-chain-fatty-acid--CoA ligase n=1 Tax=Tetranychus urticae TaxID=32264 RepID=T1K9K9_TETUR|nr:long-chain fatty acid transport protein 4-like [Tetranychus urticae]
MYAKINNIKIIFLVGCSIGVFIGLWKTLLALLTIYIVSGGWTFLRIIVRTASRDLKSLYRLVKTKVSLYLMKKRNATIPQLFLQTVKKHPNRAAILFEDQVWTFKDLDDYSNKVANAFLGLGYQPGQEVALFMDSRPEFIALWLGLSKAGIITALINANLRLATLVHSITVVKCRAVIFSSELSKAIEEIAPTLDKKQEGMQYLCLGKCDSNIISAKPLHNLIDESSSSLPSTVWKGNVNDRLFYIYTSGTTGLPKAAIIKHNRYYWMGAALRNLIGFRPNEVIYNCLPLYHLAGGSLGTCQCLIFGDTIALRAKFSASKFWTDCIKYNCTAAQYIGEICRYLLAQNPKPTDTQHKVTLMFGNGLRPKIWSQFANRFNITRIGEFYGSTEGNANVINVDNQEGSCGFISRILPSVYPVALIKIDENTNEPVRDANGMCVLCQGGECGEFVGKIIESDPSRAFDGYVDSEASKKKIVRDVFRKGDSAFLSGDLLYMDTYGYLYFKDRTGDTFRWKGENVSTSEVEAVISNILELVDCVVFGVDIPGCEGKAGMVAILETEKGLDLDNFLHKMHKVLPSFSIPVIVRIVSQMETTGTFKLTKTKFCSEGYNPQVVKDPLYVLDFSKDKYIRIDENVYNDILTSKLRI